MKVLIVDDEAVARRRLQRLLDRIDDLEVVGQAADGEEAVDKVRTLRPDVVLLDIRMPGLNGLEVARSLGSSTRVIFVTAHEEHAVQAFEASAVDYLLKPVEAERLEQALDRVRRLDAPQDPLLVERLVRQLLDRAEPPRLSARSGDTLRVFDPREICRFHSQDGYTVFRHRDREYVTDDSIVALEKRLRPWGFVRVHRSELINARAVRALRREDDTTTVELADGQHATVSRRHLPELKHHLGIAGKT